MQVNFLLQPRSVLLIIIFDLLFLPRILPLFGVPASLLVVTAYLCKYGIDNKRFLALATVATVGFLSVLFGIIFKSHPTHIEDIKRVLQLLTSLLFGFMFVRICNRHMEIIVLMLRIFFMWTLSWALLLFVMPDFYSSLNLFLYPEVAPSLEDNVIASRFNYFFSDPNSAAYFVCVALCLYLAVERRVYFLVLLMLMAGITVLLTQSRGGLIAYMVILLYAFIKDAPWSKKLVIFSITCIVALMTYMAFSEFFDSLYRLYELRRDQEEALGDGLGGGRIGKYEYFINNINALPFGVGYSLFKDGMEFRPHSDLIRINFSYGPIFLLSILYFIIPRRKECFLVFAVVSVPFLINTVIDDYKLFTLYLITLNTIHAMSTHGAEAVS
jgi:hypothetical protein